MTKLGIYEVHPAADVFPLLDDAALDEMAADIEAQGLLEPVVLTADGKTLVDGRNRYRACNRINIEPNYRRLPDDYTEKQILDFIVSTNVQRRHLDAGQRAFVALELEPMYAAQAKEKERRRKSADATLPEPVKSEPIHAAVEAAKAVGASKTSVIQAKAVQRDARDLAEKVKTGQMSLDAADKERKKREAAKPKITDPAPKPSRTMLTLFTNDGTPVEYPQPQGKPTFTNTSGPGISWAEWSWNPVTGCLHGCDYCYARELTDRYPAAFPAGFTPLFHSERLDAPANTIIPAQYRDDNHKPCGLGDCKKCAYKRVFVCSMADLYGRWVPDEWIQQVHASMLNSPQWQYILLTKFPARYVGLDLPEGAWVGTSVDEQKRVRIAQDAFAKLPDNVIKWLSLEPLLEPLQFDDLSMFDWVVIGAKTSTIQDGKLNPAFAPDFDWVVDIYQKAREAGCKVHFKPNIMDGKPGMRFPDEYPGGH